MKATYTNSHIPTATIKAYTDGGAGQVCSIVGAERERYIICVQLHHLAA